MDQEVGGSSPPSCTKPRLKTVSVRMSGRAGRMGSSPALFAFSTDASRIAADFSTGGRFCAGLSSHESVLTRVFFDSDCREPSSARLRSGAAAGTFGSPNANASNANASNANAWPATEDDLLVRLIDRPSLRRLRPSARQPSRELSVQHRRCRDETRRQHCQGRLTISQPLNTLPAVKMRRVWAEASSPKPHWTSL